MPTYDMECTGCRQETVVICKIAEREEQVCRKLECGAPLKQVLKGGHNVSAFKNGYYEHIDLEPIYCGNKIQLRDECRKRGLTSVYAEEG